MYNSGTSAANNRQTFSAMENAPMENTSPAVPAKEPPEPFPSATQQVSRRAQKSAALPPDLKTRRTQDHINESLSANHVERFILQCGYTASKLDDYGYDRVVYFYDENGYSENGLVFLQLKSVVKPNVLRSGTHIAYKLDRRHLNTWETSLYPVVLIVYDASAGIAYWLYMRPVIRELQPMMKSEQKSATVHVPIANVVDQKAVRCWKRMKDEIEARVASVFNVG